MKRLNPQNDRNTSGNNLQGEGAEKSFHPVYDILSKPTTKIKNDKDWVITIPKDGENNIIKTAKEKCKIMKFTSTWNYKDVLDIITKLKREDYPNLFIFVIDIRSKQSWQSSESARDSKRPKLSTSWEETLLEFGKDRPMVMQLKAENENVTEFYFKEVNSSNFDRVNLNKRSFETNLNFPMVLCSILKGQIDEKYCDDIVDHLADINNLNIVIRFLRVFNLSSSFFNRLVLKCAGSSSVNNLLASMDCSFDKETKSSYDRDIIYDYLENTNLEKHLQTESDTENVKTSILLEAIKNKNKEVTEYLIDEWASYIDLPVDHQVEISTTAYNTEQFDVLCDLIKYSDFPFPRNFKKDEVKNERLKKITRNRTDLEYVIFNEDNTKIKEFLDNNQDLKIIYTPDNKTISEYAWELKKYKSFFYLKSQRIKSEEFEDLKKNLNDDDRKKAKKCLDDQMKENVCKSLSDPHYSINLLCNSSRIYNARGNKDDEKHYRKKIRMWFEDIQKIEYCADLLRVAASCDKLQIVFDFKSKTVENARLKSADSYGVMTISSSHKLIFIGAKMSDNKREQQIKGTLAHELCHYVMSLVYENEERPFYQHKKDLKQKFKSITKAIDKWSITKSAKPDDNCDGIISSVFRHYDKDDFQPELIVRVVEILVTFGKEDGEKILNDYYKKLYQYFRDHVWPDMKSFHPESRKKVRKMNRTFKLLKEIESYKLKLKTAKDIKTLINHKAIIVTSSIPMLLLIDIEKYLYSQSEDLLDTKNVFVDPKVLNQNPEIFEDFKKLLKENSGLNIFVDCSDEVCDNFKDLDVNPTSHLLFVVRNTSQADEVKQNLPEKVSELKELEINYNWSDLTTESQEQLIQTKINFQNNPQISLIDLMTKNANLNKSSSAVNQPKDNIEDFSEIIDNQLLNLLMEKKQIEVNKVKEYSSDFQFLYQPRRFPISWLSEYSEDRLLSSVKNEKYVLISDIAGNGKSWATKSISKTLMYKNPTNWMTYVDLKQFIKELKAQKDEKLKFSTFLIEKILKLKTDKLEAKIFEKMYEIGKVFIIFDGFDEIAPDYAEFVSKLAVLFEQNGGNQLWIATRNHFRINLQKILQIEEAYRLNEFSEKNGAELIAKYWMLNEPEIKEITSKDKFDKHLEESTKYKKYLEMAKKLIEKVSVSLKQSIGMPQIYTIIAEISKDNKEVTLSFSQTKMYEALVDILYERWATQKGEIRNQANKDRQKEGLTFYKFHQYLAIKRLFPKCVEALFPEYDGTEWKEEEIIAGGIVVINDGQINFIHETFREYFVADFITKKLKKDSPHQEVLNMFAEVMTTEKFGVIRMFLNDSLEKQILQNIEPKMQTDKCMKMFQDMDSFADIFNRDLDNLIEFIKQVLTRKGGKFSRVLFNSACKVLANPSQFSKFKQFLFEHCNNLFLEKLITEKNIFLNLINSGPEIENFVEFVTKMEAKVGRKLVKEGLKQKIYQEIPFVFNNDYCIKRNIFFFLCKSSNLSLEKFKLFLQLITKFLTTEEIFNLMLDCDEDQSTILQVIFKYSKIKEPLKIWGEIKKWCNDQNQENLFKELVKKEDSRGSNILHYSLCLNLDQYKQFLEQMFELKILKEMITKLNSNRNSFMHVLMEDKEDKIEHTLMFFELKFGAVEIGEFLKIKNGRNQTVFELAFKFRNNNCKICKTLWQLLRQTCGTDKEFLEIISDTSQVSGNILQVVAEKDLTNEVLEFMIEELEKFDACDEIRRLLSHHVGYSPILLGILSYKEEHFEFYKKLWKVHHKNFDLSEFLKIAKYQDLDDFNFLSFLSKVIRHKNKEFVEYTWNEIKSLRNQDELRIAHYLRTEHWKNDLIELSSENCSEVHNWVQNILKEYKIDFEIQIFPEFSEKFENCIEQKSHDQLEELLTEYEKLFKSQDLLENFKYFLMMPDSENTNFVHRAILCDNVEINKVLWKRILNISDWNELNSLQKQNPFFDEILQIFTDIDWYEDSILHSAVAYSTVDVFKLLIEILEALASKDEIRDILKSVQKHWTLLYEAAKYNKTTELHAELWKFLEKYFNPQEMIEFLKKNYTYDDDYYDPLQTAVENNTKEIVELTWNKYKSFLDRDKQVEYLSENFDKLLKFSQKNNINRTDVQEWLQRIVIQYPEIIKGLKIKENDAHLKLKLSIIEKSLMSMDENGNIFYYLCKSATSKDFSVEEYLKTLQRYLNTIKIVDLMRNCNRNGENIFHVIVRAGNASELVKWLKDVRNFTQSNNLLNELIKLLFQTNSNYHNFLDLSVDNNSFEFHKTLWDCLKDLLTNYGLLNICVPKNEDSFIHLLLQNNGNPQIVEHIFNIFKSKLTEAEFVEILNTRGHQGTNLLQTAVMNMKNIEIFKIVWNLLLDFSKTDFPQILTAVDNVGRNIISVAACHSSGNHFDLLIDYLKCTLLIIEIKEMLFSFSTSQSSLHYAACNNKDSTLHEALWTHFSQHFSELEIKEIINYVDQDGNNLLYCAVRWNTKEIVELTWNQIKSNLDPNEQVEYLNATGYEGKNLYEMSLLNEDHPDVQEWVQNIIRTTLTPTSSISQLF